ncbi:MAG: NACHT domain-containing protein, partial [Planctomycetaceae bacterium]|nr:NACHT domain-containing protein [Planctomycetaceae bacterium]
GAGKSVFTRRLQAFLSDPNLADWKRFFAEKPPFVVRWERGRDKPWPEDFQSHLERQLADEISSVAQSSNQPLSVEKLVNWAIMHNRVVLILDALDQAGSRESIKTLTQFLSTDSGRRCCVVITGREYAVDDQQFGLLADFPVARIERFTPEQQYEYLRKPPALVPEVKVESTDSEQDRRWKIQRSLSVLFPGYHAFQELLSFPVVLRLVR